MDMVHAERIAAPHETQEVIDIAAVVVVIERYSGRICAFVLQDDGITLTAAVGSIGVDANRHSGRLAGTSSRLSPRTLLRSIRLRFPAKRPFPSACPR